MEWTEDALLNSAAIVAAALAAQLASAEVVRSAEAVRSLTAAVHVEAARSHTVEALTEAVRSHMAVDLMVEAHTEDMVAWAVAAKPKAPACAPQHSSFAAHPS